VVVTTHLYDGKKSLPLDIELYQHANSLPQGKKDVEFKKKPELALALIDRSLERGDRPGIVLVDAGYGNNTTFLLELEKRKLKYLGGLAKNRKVIIETEVNKLQEIRLDKLAQSLPVEEFTPVQLNVDKPKTLWVATIEVELSQLEGKRTIAIVMNTSTFDQASDIDYFITNIGSSTATAEWIVITYAQRNWVEVFYREALMMVRIV
jgi:SRSO17 transposase